MSSPLITTTPNKSVEDQITPNLATPGLQVPGSFPGPPPKSNDVRQDAQYVMNAAISTFQTAKDYVPTSVEDMKRLIENTGDTVGGYLPQSVASYFPHHTTTDASLPSESNSRNVDADLLDAGTPSDHTTNSSLVSEETSQTSSTTGGIVPALDDDERTSGIAILPEERMQQHLPSHDDDPLFATEKDESPSTGGVGALPGSKEEVDVARLPEERNSSVESISGASIDASIRPLREKVPDREVSQDTLPAFGSALLLPIPKTNTTAHASHSLSDDVNFTAVPLSYKFQKELDDESLPSETSIDEGRKLEQEQSDIAAAADLGPDSHARDATMRKKAGFMDKMKGEMKVISGRLLHNENKVEEGRRMMGKN